MRTGMAKLKPDAFLRPHFVWIPVYIKAHKDPELEESDPPVGWHMHIAWNRVYPGVVSSLLDIHGVGLTRTTVPLREILRVKIMKLRIVGCSLTPPLTEEYLKWHHTYLICKKAGLPCPEFDLSRKFESDKTPTYLTRLQAQLKEKYGEGKNCTDSDHEWHGKSPNDYQEVD